MGCAPSRYGERVSSEAEWAVAVRASQTREAHEQERQEDEALAAALEPGGSSSLFNILASNSSVSSSSNKKMKINGREENQKHQKNVYGNIIYCKQFYYGVSGIDSDLLKLWP